MVVLLAVTGGILYGANITAATFRFGGLVGWLLPEDKRPFTLVTLGLQLTEDALDQKSASHHASQILYFLFALAVPLLQQVCFVGLWCTPLRRRTQRAMYYVTEIVRAWSSLEVFVLSVILAVLQLPLLAKFIVGDKCDAINDLLADFFDKALEGDDTCFSVETHLDTGIWVLLASSVVCAIYTGMLLTAFSLVRYSTSPLTLRFMGEVSMP
jgi:hypothetical protein